MKSDKVLFLGIIIGALTSTGSTAWAGSHASNGDNFPDYTQLEYNKPLPPVDQQLPPAPPGGIPLKINMGQTSDSAPLEAIPVRLGRSSQGPDESEPSMAGMLDDSHVSTSTAMAPPAVSTTSTTLLK